MGYSDSEVEPLAQRMVAQLPGLDIRLARVWIKSESGVNGNPLGVTHVENGVSKLNTYSTREEGIDGAVALIKRSSNYAGIRASLGQPVNVQAAAVIASPWHARNSPYYTRVFTQAGLLATRGIAPLVGGDGATLASSPGVGTILDFQARLREIGVNDNPSHIITEAEAWLIVQKLYKLNGDNSITRGIMQTYAGKTVTQAWDSGNPKTIGPDPLGALGDAAGALGDWGAGLTAILGALLDPENWAYIGAIVIGVPAALFGFYLLAGVQTGGQNA